jgi:DNA repair protein RadC
MNIKEINLQYKDTGIAYDNIELSQPNAVHSYLRGAFDFRPEQEQLWVILLDVKLHPIGRYLVSLGSVSSTTAHPREVFKPAILASASSIVLAHNHPSRSLEASVEDLEAVERFRKAGELLGISVLDQLIVAGTKWRSIHGDS